MYAENIICNPIDIENADISCLDHPDRKKIFAGDLFPGQIAFRVVAVNYVLDAILSTTSLATNIYVRSLAENQEELTSTLSTGISINHLIAILSAPAGGWIWVRFGIGYLFTFAAVMAVFNTLFAMTIPKPEQK